MATRIATNARNTLAEGVRTRLDAGSGNGYVEVRTGSQPATANTAASGTLLATLPLSKPSFGNASNGSIALSGTPSATAVASGTAGWFRAYDSAGNVVIDGAIPGDATMTDANIVTGGTVTMNSWSVTMPAG
jgi:hypothetical protein